MKLRFIFCLFALLLLPAGCRGPSQPVVSEAAPAPSASVLPSQVPATASTAGEDAPMTPSPTESTAPSPEHSASVPAGSATPAVSADTSPTPKPAPSEDVGATLDEIIKELNDLDKLYSQMDNLSESDLN